MRSSPERLLFGLLTLVGVGVGAVTVPTSSAQADVVNLNPCDGSVLTQPFAPWGDRAWYELTPGGDFKSLSWTLTGSAQLVAGSEPYAVTGSSGSRSLSLPAGSSATSPLMCVDAESPSMRFFIAGAGKLEAGLVYDGTYIHAGDVDAEGDWQPTSVILTDSALCGLLSSGSAQVSVRLTALSGDPQVDDIFVDPWNRG